MLSEEHLILKTNIHEYLDNITVSPKGLRTAIKTVRKMINRFQKDTGHRLNRLSEMLIDCEMEILDERYYPNYLLERGSQSTFKTLWQVIEDNL
jgi:hypothetical protein